ncbi:acyl-CoA thioesterase [Saccharothrix australiensis]|uniref:Enediyne biosynthesis thioesterase n=1 Tax=Saccharothrix australiensis TaxID=2072 RepID=A0A495VZC7_9PSEU|nr:acyl-CoA thioesterase [Saccharothrix australiensis]RKT54574.1 enediyne biosynthesis thioesterase [Saccharothrix australiensis]
MTRSYAYRHLITLDETNLAGNVYFAHYLRWQGHCRERFLAEHAPGVLGALANGFTLVTTTCDCQYLGELTAGDTVELRMTLTELDDNRVGMAFDYLRVNAPVPQLVARGGQSVACMSRGPEGLVPVPVPAELRNSLHPYSATR